MGLQLEGIQLIEAGKAAWQEHDPGGHKAEVKREGDTSIVTLSPVRLYPLKVP